MSGSTVQIQVQQLNHPGQVLSARAIFEMKHLSFEMSTLTAAASLEQSVWNFATFCYKLQRNLFQEYNI